MTNKSERQRDRERQREQEREIEAEHRPQHAASSQRAARDYYEQNNCRFK